jgi:hypothetical protein
LHSQKRRLSSGEFWKPKAEIEKRESGKTFRISNFGIPSGFRFRNLASACAAGGLRVRPDLGRILAARDDG